MTTLIVKLKQGVEEGAFGFILFFFFYILVNPHVKAH